MAKSPSPKYLREAPEWFDLKKYDAVRGLDAKGWLYQLSSRLVLDVLWQPPPDDIDDQLDVSEDNEWTQTAEAMLDDITKDGVLKLPYDLPDRFPDPYDEHFGAASFEYDTVRSITNSDVYKDLYFPQQRDKILAMINSLRNPSSCDASDRISSQKWADELFRETFISSAFVEIDLSVNNAQLLKNFRKWLSNARRNLEYPKRQRNFTDYDFGTWQRTRVLPYIDLQLWAEKHGKKYTHDMMANLLFDEKDVVGKDKVRRTVKPHVDEFRNAYPALRAQVEGTLTTQLT